MPRRASSRNLFGWLTKKTVTYQRSRGQASPSIRAYRAGVLSGDTGAFDSWLAKQPGVRDAGRSTRQRLEAQYRRGVERAGHAERVKEAKKAKAGTRKSSSKSGGKFKGVRIIPSGDGFKLSAIDRESTFDTVQDAKDFIRDSKANPCAVTRRRTVTDRAKRYRANQPGCKPGGVKQCKLCKAKRDLMVDHKDGDESNGRKSNLRWLCRSCNTYLGAEMARTGQGRRTVQYNPSEKGGAQNLYQYMLAVLQHTRGAHDEGGKIIHATPKSKRRQYASEFWAARKAHERSYSQYENPATWGFGIYQGSGFSTRQVAHFKSKAEAEAYARSAGLKGYSIKRAFRKDETENPAAEKSWYGVSIFDGVSKLGGKVEFQAPTLQGAQEKAQFYADDMGYDSVLYDIEGKSLGRFTSQRPILPGGGRGSPNPDGDLYDRIQEHLRSGGVVAVRTALKHTNYLPKHAAMFRRPSRETETGVYVQRGKHWDYVFPQYVHFGRYKTNPEPETTDTASEEYEQARKIAELFHGRAVKEEITIDETVRQHDWYWRIGPLVSLKVKTLTKQKITIPFHLTEEGMVHLFCSPDGRQFYLRGGDQELNLDAIRMGPKSDWYRDHMIIGEATEITYQDKKRFNKFSLTDYYHKLGEVTKKKPQLLYDAFAKKLQIVGGQYRVETEELVESMSPGIVN